MADTRFNRAFVNDAQGNAVYVNQGAGTTGNPGGRIQNLPGGYIGGSIGDAANPGHIQRQLVVNGEVLARYGDAPNTEKLPTSSSDKPTYQNTAEFKLNAAPLKLKGANLDPVAYTIVGGETLKDIARNVLGDASLWWRIADANGLSVSGDGQLTPGQTLSVPKLALNSNNVETFQPYDPSQVTGSTDPLLPALAGQGGRGCGGLGRIIMVVVAVVASIYTAGAASALLGTAGTTLSGAMAAGSAALTGGGLAGIGAGAMAIGGAVGSIASQAVGNLIGAQDGFSWRSVGLSAIGGGISGGMGGWAPLGEATTTGTAVGNAMMRAAVGNVASQGIGVVTGLQSSFSWQSVAASAVGAGVGQAVAPAYAQAFGGSDLGQFGARLATSVTSGMAAAVMRGGRVAIQQVAVDAFGNALGQSLASASTGAELQGQTAKGLYSLGGPGDGEPGLRLGGGEGLSFAGMRASSTQEMSVNLDSPMAARLRVELGYAPASDESWVLAGGPQGTVSDAGNGLGPGSRPVLAADQRFKAHALGVYDAGVGVAESAAYSFGLIGPPESRAAWAVRTAEAAVQGISRFANDPGGTVSGWWDNLTGDDPAAIRQATAQGTGLALGVAGGMAMGRLGGVRSTGLGYDISRWGEYGLPSDGYFVRTLTREQYLDLQAGRSFSFGGKPAEGYPSGMGFVGSAEEVRGLTTVQGYREGLKLSYDPKYVLEFQLSNPSGLQNVIRAPYAEFVPGGKTGAGFSEWNYPGIGSSEIVNGKVRVLKK